MKFFFTTLTLFYFRDLWNCKICVWNGLNTVYCINLPEWIWPSYMWNSVIVEMSNFALSSVQVGICILSWPIFNENKVLKFKWDRVAVLFYHENILINLTIYFWSFEGVNSDPYLLRLFPSFLHLQPQQRPRHRVRPVPTPREVHRCASPEENLFVLPNQIVGTISFNDV